MDKSYPNFERLVLGFMDSYDLVFGLEASEKSTFG